MRVIAGALGGRHLVAPRGQATRPTSDRVREALFSALGDVQGSIVLDLFAGTGALGIEALSRGAARATFVESSRAALVALRANLSALGLVARSDVLGVAAERAIRELGRSAAHDAPFDLVLVDPPYAQVATVPPLVAALGACGALASDARIVIEHASRDPPPSLEGVPLVSTRTYGDTAVSTYRRG